MVHDLLSLLKMDNNSIHDCLNDVSNRQIHSSPTRSIAGNVAVRLGGLYWSIWIAFSHACHNEYLNQCLVYLSLRFVIIEGKEGARAGVGLVWLSMVYQADSR